MKTGVSVVGPRALFEVTIDGRGGDSVHEEYFVSRDDAVIASAVDGQNREPREVDVYEMSDGSFVQFTHYRVSPSPSQTDRRKILESLTPAQRLLMEGRT